MSQLKARKIHRLVRENEKLPDWIKQKIIQTCELIQHRIERALETEWKVVVCPLNLDAERESVKINDDIAAELIQYLDLLGDYVDRLGFDNNLLSSKGIKLLLDSFSARDAKYKGISFEFNLLDDKSIDLIGRYIQSNQSLQEISFGRYITNNGVEKLATYIQGSEHLKMLYLRRNKGINNDSISVLNKMIQTSRLQMVSTKDTFITQRAAFTASLIHNVIKYGSGVLNFVEWSIKDEDVIKICEFMKIYGIERYTSIKLANNSITSQGASFLFDTLKECRTLVNCIDLNQNLIDDTCMKSLDKGIEVFASYLIENTTFQSLLIDGNKYITEKSIPILLKSIESSHITNISCGNFKSFTEAFQVALLYNLVKRGNLSISLPQIELKEDGILKLTEYFETCGVNQLKKISVGACCFSMDTAIKFFMILNKHRVTVIDVTFSADVCTDEWVKAIGECIQDIDCFEKITIVNGEFADKDIEILCNCLFGTITLNSIVFQWVGQVTDASVPFLVALANKSHINEINVTRTLISDEKKVDLEKILCIPNEKREVPIKSNSKSAAKAS